MNRNVIPVVLTFIIFLISVPPVTADTYRIATFNAGDIVYAEQVIKQAYQRIGHEIELTVLPGKRSLSEVNKGEYDAELIRIEGTEKIYNNLLRIPTPVMLSETIILTAHNSTLSPTQWEQLAGLSIGIPAGVKLVEDRTHRFNPIRVTNTIALLKMVAAGRIDLAVMPSAMAKQYEEFNQLRVVKPAIETVELFHFVHKKHRGLVKPLQQQLKNNNKQVK